MQVHAAAVIAASRFADHPDGFRSRWVPQRLRLGIWVFSVFAKVPGREKDDTMIQYIKGITSTHATYWFLADDVMREVRCHVVVDGLELRVVDDVECEESLWRKFGVAMGDHRDGDHRTESLWSGDDDDRTESWSSDGQEASEDN